MTARLHLLWMLPAALLGTAGIWMLRTFDPNVAGNPFPQCLIYNLTGLFCPGCGTTRALHALVHFDVAGAIGMNALTILGAPIGVLLALRGFEKLPASFEPWLKPLANAWLWLGLVTGFTVLRNLPGFEWLAPG